MAARLTEQLRVQPPLFHGAGTSCFGLAWKALAWLEANLEAGTVTLETGMGMSTLIFAAAGTRHTAIGPSADERDRILRYCKARGISMERVRFLIAPSHMALVSNWRPEQLDVVLIDGAHGYPYPALDWFLTSPHLRVGGVLIVDDGHLRPVNELVRYLRRSSSWRHERTLGDRTLCFRKLHESLPEYGAVFGTGRPRFNYLPLRRRSIASTRFLLLDRSPLSHVVRAAITRRSTKGS